MTVANNFAMVKVQGEETPVKITITNDDKPIVSEKYKNKWQNLLNILAECLFVPTGLIMQLNQNDISVFLSSFTESNPYNAGDSDHLLHGLYCETVVGTDSQLLVPNALEDDLWKSNPDVKLGMISYLGFPLKWPDGEIFGTICVLDNKTNNYSNNYISLVEFLKNSIEDDLSSLMYNYQKLQKAYTKQSEYLSDLVNSKTQLENLLEEKNILLSETHHRVKNNLQIISSMIQLQLLKAGEINNTNPLISIKNRILSMGAIHETLYSNNNFCKIKIKKYLQVLASRLEESLYTPEQTHEFIFKIDSDLNINLDTAIPIGLIANEIITNSIKYAFENMNSGEIIISIQEHSPTHYLMKISDNGIGLPEHVFNNSKGLGHELIKMLTKQLNGTFELNSNSGTSYEFILEKSTKEDNRWLNQ